MWHSSIQTTMEYYVNQTTDDLRRELWKGAKPKAEKQTILEDRTPKTTPNHRISTPQSEESGIKDSSEIVVN